MMSDDNRLDAFSASNVHGERRFSTSDRDHDHGEATATEKEPRAEVICRVGIPRVRERAGRSRASNQNA